MRTMPCSVRAFAVVALCTLAISTGPGRAQAWPHGTVRVILPLPPGSPTDIAARIVAERLAERWGKPVIVENRQGGDGIPAITAFLAARDNHTLLFSFAGLITINPLIHEKLPYDPARDLVPVASVAANLFGIVVPETLKVNSLEDFVKLARSQPGKLNWAATPGLPHYIFAALQKSAGLELVQVAYRDFTPAMQDLGEGRIHAAATGLGILLPHVHAGRAKLLVVTDRERSTVAPTVPTAKEAGYPELTFEGVVGIYGWRDIPSDLKERIAADIRIAAADPALAKRLAGSGTVLRIRGPAEFAAAIEEQRAKVLAIAQATKAAK